MTGTKTKAGALLQRHMASSDQVEFFTSIDRF